MNRADKILEAAKLKLTTSAIEWHKLFTKINNDIKTSGNEKVIPLKDFDYYADQIHNLTDEKDYEKSLALAKKVAKLEK